MTRDQALKKLRKIYGDRACYNVRPQATSPERRAAARERMILAKRERDEAQREYDARLAEVMAEFQARPDIAALIAILAKTRKQQNEAMGEAYLYKFEIGYVSEVGFGHIEAAGDTWEDAFTKLAEQHQHFGASSARETE